MNILQRFREYDIPYKDFERIGYTKEDILTKMDKMDLESLLSGKRTSLFPVRGIDDKGQNFSEKCKFSLYRKEDGSTALQLHPVRMDIKNDIDLTDKEIKKLRKDQLVTKTINGERYIVQLDKETNELLRVKTKEINIPSHIKDVELGNAQREKLRKGQLITIESGKEKMQVGLDLNNQKGLKFSDANFELKQKEAFDRHNPQIIGTIHTDRNRQEYLDYKEKSENKKVIPFLNRKSQI
ncbi:DUF3945 domain-containing protein [Bacteroidales bacterium OttesenSCG-928-B11]|nr:DUF3945 domain-containing protein [Bacteroidales bacterium OttesenSCG-928-E04]MDL2312563.1 DUF3945 domain-containing protein [Bacteroidales bacterium OttesenSCG-928-B11]MDL2325826.1 DUF3945 domain-containing protein [Bacteroidales bacterium OttesenSCG-928-A14]